MREINKKRKFSEIKKDTYNRNPKVFGWLVFLLDYVEDDEITKKEIEIIDQIFYENVIFALEEI